MATVSVRMSSRFVKVSATRNSFQQLMNTRIAAAMTPGRASGMMMSLRIMNGEHPSRMAASSSSRGMAEKKPRRSQMLNATLPDVYSRTMARYVFISLSLPIRRNIGMMFVSPGSIMQTRKSTKKASRPGNLLRLMTYAASDAAAMVATTVAVLSRRLLRKNRRKGMETKRYR